MSWPERDRTRVVVTGVGAVTPLGETAEESHESLVAGRSGISRWRHPEEDCYSKIGGDMSGFDLNRHLEHIGAVYSGGLRKRTRRLLRITTKWGRLTTCAALQAYHHAGCPSCARPPSAAPTSWPATTSTRDTATAR